MAKTGKRKKEKEEERPIVGRVTRDAVAGVESRRFEMASRGWVRGTMWVRFWAKFRAFAIIYNRGRPP